MTLILETGPFRHPKPDMRITHPVTKNPKHPKYAYFLVTVLHYFTVLQYHSILQLIVFYFSGAPAQGSMTV